MDFKNFAVASTTFQDVPNTPLEKMILLGSAFTLDLYTPWKVFKIGLNKRLKADRLRIILQTTRWCEMDINPSLLYQKLFRWHCRFQIKSIRGWLHAGNSNSWIYLDYLKGDQPHELLQSKAEVNLLIQGQRKQISFRTLTTRVTNLPWDLARPQ